METAWVAFFHLIPILWYAPSYGKWRSVSINFSYSKGKSSKTYLMGEIWDIDSKVRVLFSHQVSNLSYSLSHKKCMVFPSISHSMVKCSRTHLWEGPGIQIPILLPKYGYFSTIKFSTCGIHMENAWVFPSISHSMEKQSKTNPWEIPRIQIPILFSKQDYFCSMKFRTYGILYHVGNSLVLPSISHSI